MEKVLVITENARLYRQIADRFGNGFAAYKSGTYSGACRFLQDNQFAFIIIDSSMPGSPDRKELLDRNSRCRQPAIVQWHYNAGHPPAAEDNCAEVISADSSLYSPRNNQLKFDPSKSDLLPLKDAYRFISPAMQQLDEQVSLAALCDENVMLIGETGCGKDTIALQLHMQSRRCAGPFRILRAASYDDNLLESTLFGHVKGSFTGANTNKRGMIAEAEGGTAYIPEFSSLSPSVQVKLLYLMENRIYQPVGANEYRKADIRIITGWTYVKQISEEKDAFRSDLIQRAMGHPIVIRPLRQRKEDIILLAEYFLKKVAAEFNLGALAFSKEVKKRIIRAKWQGNIRHLYNAVRYSVIKSRSRIEYDNIISARYFTVNVLSPDVLYEEECARPCIRRRLTRTMALAAIKECHNNKTAAARMLRISKVTLYNILDEKGGKGTGACYY